MKLDIKDQKLLTLLQNNSRTPISDLARHVHLARSTVQERLKRLEQDGVIEAYTIRLNRALLEQQKIRARIAISVRAPMQSALIRALEGMTEVVCCETVSGQNDILIELLTDTPYQLDEFVAQLGTFDGVESTETSIIFRQFFNR